MGTRTSTQKAACFPQLLLPGKTKCVCCIVVSRLTFEEFVNFSQSLEVDFLMLVSLID